MPVMVSTHVPARGGHSTGNKASPVRDCFNTRARARRAPIIPVNFYSFAVFQHTCPREAGTLILRGRVFFSRFQHTCPREAGTSFH